MRSRRSPPFKRRALGQFWDQEKEKARSEMQNRENSDTPTEDFLTGINTNEVSAAELMEVVEEVNQLHADQPQLEDIAIVILQLHPDSPDKRTGIMFRMEALARLLSEEGVPGWTLPGPSGSLFMKEAVLAAAAVQPVIEKDNHVAFEHEAFLQKVLELAQPAGEA